VTRHGASETTQTRGRGGCAEHAAHGRRVKASSMKRRRRRHADADRDLVADDQRQK
jgi:hypothetical protein